MTNEYEREIEYARNKPKPPPMMISHGGRALGGVEHPADETCPQCEPIKLKRRRWFMRFINSYLAYRKCVPQLGRWASMRAAWDISRL